MQSVNLVIAAYGGERRASCNHYDVDRTLYLSALLQNIANLEHGISKIFIVAPPPEFNRDDFNAYLRVLEHSYKGKTELTIVHRKSNNGISYGAFSDVYQEFQESGYWLFMEDDYIWAQANFEQVYINKYEESGACMVTPMARPTEPKHAAVGICFSHSRELDIICERNGRLPHDAENRSYGEVSQILFSRGFTDAGFDIIDTMCSYRFYMRNHLKGHSPHGDLELPDLILPVTMRRELHEKS